MTCCTAHAFDGCACRSGSCQSITVRLETVKRKHAAAWRQYLLAQQNAFCAAVMLMAVAIGMCFAAVSAEASYREEDIRNQEIHGRIVR